MFCKADLSCCPTQLLLSVDPTHFVTFFRFGLDNSTVLFSTGRRCFDQLADNRQPKVSRRQSLQRNVFFLCLFQWTIARCCTQTSCQTYPVRVFLFKSLLWRTVDNSKELCFNRLQLRSSCGRLFTQQAFINMLVRPGTACNSGFTAMAADGSQSAVLHK